MTPEEVRASFEKLMPLPTGVSWDGDHYIGDRNFIGSARNATTWAEILRGYRLAFQQSNWISVNESLPFGVDHGEVFKSNRYAITDGFIVEVGYFNGANGGTGRPESAWVAWSDYNNIKPDKITHWQKLPSAPVK